MRASSGSDAAVCAERHHHCRSGAERDRIVLIQTVLLMTYWHENQDDPKDFRHWLEIALSQH